MRSKLLLRRPQANCTCCILVIRYYASSLDDGICEIEVWPSSFTHLSNEVIFEMCFALLWNLWSVAKEIVDSLSMNLCTRSGNWGPARPAHWQTTVNNSAQKGHGASLGVLFLGRCARPAAQLSTTRIVGPVRGQRGLPPLTFWDYPFTLFKNQVYINVHIIIFTVYINVRPFSPTDTYHPLSEESLPTECFPTSIPFCKRYL